MALDARALRERRKARIAARMATAQDNDMPEWLEEKVEEESEPGTDVGEPGVDPDVEQATAEDEMEEEHNENIEELGEDIQELAEDMEELEEDKEAAEEPVEEGAALGAFQYNPVYQKPTHLGNDVPSSGYHYYGPPPDAGTSYGYYADASSGLKLIAPLAKSVFSPVSGKAMKFEGKVGIDGLASVLALADQMTKLSLASGEERMTSAPLGEHETPKMFDALTGTDISDDVATMRAENEADEMMMDEVPEEPVESMEEVDMPADLGEGKDEMVDDDSAMEEAEKMMQAMEEPPVAMEGPPVAEEVEEEEPAEEEMELPPEDEEAESVKYEALQELDAVENEPLSEADVHMTLFDEQDDAGHIKANPYWNVDIKGQPVARVYLQDQPKPEEIREVFCSADYHRGVAGAIEKVGLKPVLKQIKAHLWVNRLHETRFAKQVKAEVEASANAKVVATTKNLMRDLLERVAIVCAGMDKNFYREAGNPLKEALWGELHGFGITNPSPMIEAAFRKGSTKYFETVLDKAIEYMEMEPKALAQVRKAIGEADVLAPGDETAGAQLPDATPASPEEMPTLNQRLAASSVAIGGLPAISGDALGDHKRALRSELKLGGAGPKLKR